MSDNFLSESEDDDRKGRGGALAWMAKNSVAANILMLVLLIGGGLKSCTVKQEVFPEFDIDQIIINVPYPGASPAEVEQGVLLAAEEAVRGLDGIKKVRATALEGMAVVVVELLLGTDADQALSDVKSAMDRITSFPENIERPVISLAKLRNQVISLVVYGDQDEASLKAYAEKMRDELLADPRITVVELKGARPLEISVEVPQRHLREYGLTLEQVANGIRASSVELPGGGVKTPKGEVLLRTAQRRERGIDFEDIVVVSRPDGTRVRLGELAEVKDGFADNDQRALYLGKPAIMLSVFRVGDQKPLEISAAVKEHVGKSRASAPPGIELATWFDTSEFYAERLDLLIRNALMGFVLVLLILGLFLEVKLAFWVTLGIPISFIGSMLILPSTDVSINMISLFAFIIVLGMVVDDAIIVGEAVYRRRQLGAGRVEAAIQGVKEVAAPVIFAVLTTMIAYTPLMFVPGVMGKFFRVIPIAVITVLCISLVESLLILPAHLAHSKKSSRRGVFGHVDRQQERFSHFFERMIQRFYVPVATRAISRRYLTASLCLALLLSTCGLVGGGHVRFTQFPKVEADVITAVAELPYGTSADVTRRLEQRMLEIADEVIAAHGGRDKNVRGVFSQVGATTNQGMDPSSAYGGGSHIAEVMIYLVPSGDRTLRLAELAKAFNDHLRDEFPGLDSFRAQIDTGPPSGSAIEYQFNHRDMTVLAAVSEEFARRIADYAGVLDIDDGLASGKEQLNLAVTEQARSLGLTELELARQVRNSFFGAEAARQQRGRDELRVYVRLPKEERGSEYDIEELIIRTPGGGELPLAQAASIERGQSYTDIRRIDGRRAVTVTAEVDQAAANATEVNRRIAKELLPELLGKYPGVTYQVGGEQEQTRETNTSLFVGFGMAVIAIVALLAVAFRSYIQPFIIITVIPFGIVGAVFGHLLMGYDLSMMSLMGVVALSGVVVNDSLILVVAINRLRQEDKSPVEAAVAAGALRFRAILLTSLTTFFGLAPMILETSVQARFLIPMAISLGFGVLFATGFTLLLVPSLYVILDDAKRAIVHTWRYAGPSRGGESNRHRRGGHGDLPRAEAISSSTPKEPRE